jgi:hypothetical protein
MNVFESYLLDFKACLLNEKYDRRVWAENGGCRHSFENTN